MTLWKHSHTALLNNNNKAQTKQCLKLSLFHKLKKGNGPLNCEKKSKMGNSNTKLNKKDKQLFMDEFNVKSDKFDAIVRSFKYHAGKEGKITLDKFIKIFDGTIDDDLARKIFVTFDHDQDGAIELREYLRMMGISHWGSVDQKLRATFQVFNKSKNDVLSRDEFQQMYVSMVRQKRAAIHFKETGRRFSANSEVLTQDELDAINAKITPLFTKIDVDKSDTIDYDEFVNGYLKYPDECAFFKQF